MTLLLAGDGFRMAFGGRIGELTGTRLLFLADEPNPCEAQAYLELSDCRFDFGDIREAPEDSPSRLKFSAMLSVTRPDQTAFLFAERNA